MLIITDAQEIKAQLTDALLEYIQQAIGQGVVPFDPAHMTHWPLWPMHPVDVPVVPKAVLDALPTIEVVGLPADPDLGAAGA